VTSVSPAVASAGSAGITLKVLGSNLSSQDIVLWNGKASPTQLISSTELQAAISSSLIAAPGTAKIAAMNSSTGETSRPLTFTIVQTPPLTISTSSVPLGTALASYSTTLLASGGVTPYGWSLASGTLPPGLSLSVAGVISGTPAQSGQFSFTAKVTDSSATAQSATKGFSLSIPATVATLNISSTSLPGGTVSLAYSANFSANGGTSPYAWSVISGSLAPGLTLNTAGTISGTPTQAGQFSFGVRVSDSSSPSQTASGNFSINVAAQVTPLSITTTSLPSGTVSSAYSAALSASGGVTPYSWSAVSGSLPPGLTLSALGAISGTPTQAGQFSFGVRVSDSSSPSQTASGSFTINIAQSGSSGITYQSRTDTNFDRVVVPALCTSDPCNMTSTDMYPCTAAECGLASSLPALTYTRVTGTHTAPTFDPNDTYRTDDSSEQDTWTRNNDVFYVWSTNHGYSIFFRFDSSNQTVARMSCNYGGVSCYNNSYDGFNTVGIGADGTFGRTEDYTYYASYNDNAIEKMDFAATLSNPNTAPTLTQVANVNACPNIPTTGSLQGVTMNSTDSRFALYLGGGQDVAPVVYVYDKTLGCRWLAVKNTGAVTGGTAGGDSGWGAQTQVTLLDWQSNPLSWSSYQGTGIHNVRLSKDGALVRLTLQSSGGTHIWDPVNNVVYFCSANSPTYVQGHQIIGFNHIFIDSSFTSNGWFQKRTIGPTPCGALNNSQYLITGSMIPTGYSWGDDHQNWNTAAAGAASPLMVGSVGSSTPAHAWEGEMFGVSTDLNNRQVWRFGRTYSTTTTFASQPHPNVSHDGKWAIFNSDWNGTLGRASDVFLMPLR
jgi:hypothetical protein